MNILIIGNGRREHALAWKAAQSKLADNVYVAPGNADTALEPALQNVDIAAIDIPVLVDAFRAAGRRIFGPTQAAAQLEGSKAFSKDFLARHGIPTARYENFTEVAPALDYVRQRGAPIVIKADGLAAGKGVISP